MKRALKAYSVLYLAVCVCVKSLNRSGGVLLSLSV